MAALEGKMDELTLAQGGEMGDEDWSVNAKGEVRPRSVVRFIAQQN
jgi:hypothetical protein